MRCDADTQAAAGMAGRVGRPRIRLATSDDHEALSLLWRRSVEATHHFLPSAEVERLFEDVRRLFLPGVEALWVAEVMEDVAASACPQRPCAASSEAPPGGAVGFMGCNGSQVEMLFVDPACFRRGFGAVLLAHAKAGHQRLTLDVNEQNPQALTFYARQGFRVVGRSAQDGQGMPYPLLHMEWQRPER